MTKHHNQMRLPLDDLHDDVDLKKLSDTEFKELLLSDGDDLDAPFAGQPDQNASAAFGRPLTEQEWQEVLRELDRAVEEILAEEEKPR